MGPKEVKRKQPAAEQPKPDQHQHHHRHRHRSQSEPRQTLRSSKEHRERESAPRSEVQFKDLDCNRETFTFSVRLHTLVAKLDSVIRRRSKYAIADDSRILFFRGRRLLDPCGTLGDGCHLVYYRVVAGGEDDTTFKVMAYGPDTELFLDKTFRDQLVRDIEAGETVGSLRAKVAGRMCIQDTNRIVVLAHGGLRSGPLEGVAWEIRQVRTWLCRQIAIDLNPEKQYIILRGLGLEYIFQPEDPKSLHTEVQQLKTIVQTRLVAGVHEACNSKIPLRRDQIKIIYDRRAKGSTSHVPWGCTVDFQLPDGIAEAFEADGNWLLPLAVTCSVCSDDKRVTEMPQRVTVACGHKPTICKDCLGQWIQSSLDTSSWDRLKCPECPLFLQFEDVRKHASADVFVRYDDLATRAVLKDIPNFRWCLSAKCKSGQIFASDSCAKLKCEACGYRQCVHHNVPWHGGETCDAYDKRNRQRQNDEKASEEAIKKTSKMCPNCKKDVHKWTGCNHITCVCRHEWCYVCFAAYQRNEHGFLYCRHNPECTERDPFLEFVEGPAAPARAFPGFGIPAPLRVGRRPGAPPPPVAPHGRPHLRPAEGRANRHNAAGNGNAAPRRPPPPFAAPEGNAPPPPPPPGRPARPDLGNNAEGREVPRRVPVPPAAPRLDPPAAGRRRPMTREDIDEAFRRRNEVLEAAILGVRAAAQRARRLEVRPVQHARPPGPEDAPPGGEDDLRQVVVEEIMNRLRL